MLSDHVNPRAPGMLAWSWAFFGLAVVIVALRFWARKIRKLPWEIDDYSVLVALFFVCTTCICNSLYAILGMGQHIDEISASNLRKFKMTLYFGNLAYVSDGPWFKIAGLLMYRRIFATRRFRIVTEYCCYFVVVWWLAEMLCAVLICIPPSGFWDEEVAKTAQCMDARLYDLQYAIINIILDAAILILPVRMIMGLHLSAVKRLGFACLFSVGIFATIAAIVRIILFLAPMNVEDWTYVWYQGVILSCVEPSIGIISVCLPVMRPVLIKILPKRYTKGLRDAPVRIMNSYHARRESKTVATNSTFDGSTETGESIADNKRPFVRMDSTATSMHDAYQVHGTQEGFSRATAVGTEARPSDVDDGGRVIEMDGIVRRTDVELQYEVEEPKGYGIAL